MLQTLLSLWHDVVDFAECIHLDIEHVCDTLGLARLVVLLVDLWITSCQLHVLFLYEHCLVLVELGEMTLVILSEVLVVLDILISLVFH